MIKLTTILCCAALLSGCAYSRSVRDYFVDPAQYWSNKAIANCRDAEQLREYHQRCLINKKRELKHKHGVLPENWEQVCESDHKAFLQGQESLARLVGIASRRVAEYAIWGRWHSARDGKDQ